MSGHPTRADRYAAQNARGKLRHREKIARLSIGRFNSLIGAMRGAARRKGYALAVHGSLLRDIDIVAVPWVPRAAGPLALVRAIIEAIRGTNLTAFCDCPRKQPTVKPHDRLAWAIHMDGGTYIDLSVMPRRSK